MNPFAVETLTHLRHRELLAEAERWRKNHVARSRGRGLRLLAL